MSFHSTGRVAALAQGLLSCGALLLVVACDRNDSGIPAVEIRGAADAVEFGPFRWRDATHAQVVVRMTGTGETVDAIRYEFFEGDRLIDQGIVPGNILSERGREVVRYWPMVTTFHAAGQVDLISVKNADRLVIRIDPELLIPADNLRRNHSTRPLP